MSDWYLEIYNSRGVCTLAEYGHSFLSIKSAVDNRRLGERVRFIAPHGVQRGELGALISLGAGRT